MYNPVQVANKFIALGKQHGIPLTHMQLQKLTYIAHGYYLAMTGRPLINEPVSAWKYGPVIPGMYDAFKGYRDSAVQHPALEPTSLPLDEQANSIIQGVLMFYGRKNGIELSQLTHMDDTPWSKAFNGFSNTIIPNNEIQNYYQRLIQNNGSCHGL